MKAPSHLTKEDLRQSLSCPVKPLHRWAELSSKNDDDAFLQFLAEEGRTVGRTARRLFRNLILIDEGFEDAERTTRDLLRIPSLTLAESAFSSGVWRIRPDILSVDLEQGLITVYEVKAKTASLQKYRKGAEFLTFHGEIRAAWREILFDLAMQVVVLERVFPEMRIRGHLILPAEECPVSEEECLFASSATDSPAVADTATIARRRTESVLRILDPGDALGLAKKLVVQAMKDLERVRAGSLSPEPILRYQCRNCEYRLKNGRDPKDGFHQCWGSMADPDPHLFALHQLYQIGGQASYANRKIQEERTALLDVSEEDLRGSPYEDRQRMQLRGMRNGEEWLGKELGKIIQNLERPLRFLDFETSMAAIPWFARLRPYELLPIQFSQHTLDEKGNLRHGEWLHTGQENPILPFAKALLSAVGDSGHIMIYTDYELRVLRGVIEYLRRTNEGLEEAERLDDLLGSGRVVDQHDILYRHYHHPLMGGKTSLKNVADAIWRESPRIRSHRWFSAWGNEERSPYKMLPGMEIAGKSLRIADGCGAMEAYAELSRGGHSETDRRKIRTAMLRYCELDTLSQVMIHAHWNDRAADDRKSS